MTKDQSIDELIRQHGDRLRGLSHGAYAELARAACGDSPAVSASIRADKIDPERRFSNIIRTAVLRHLNRGATVGRSPDWPSGALGTPPLPTLRPTASTLRIAREPGDESERGLDLHGLDLV